ncbi:MAG TPA: AzlD domain-containing protein [Burkholderiaceae bacterium]|nr:AzlD domain-containing protein [Burkholderiaceae bacterium]HMX09977.1 AzlD domain-containing protein [Burkholderiaceae bacterium]HMY99808.1 AzlD domain-containing protein [Burkholderiaceae bacterium]HNB47377.1 AzlD domain-containing protein [Burkholderiaceae bacterium]HNG78839.1 AzlD domain-containing protein [Burkholderiaceae bacterium]
MNTGEAIVTILGLGLVTVLARSFFLLPDRELPMPPIVRRALRYAPLAALVAIVVPEVLLTRGVLIHTWADARLLAALAGAGWFAWRRGILGTIATGMLVYLPLHVGLGW